MKTQTPNFPVARLARALATAFTLMAGVAVAGEIMVLPEATSGNILSLERSAYELNGERTPIAWSYATVAGGYSDGNAAVENNIVYITDPTMVTSSVDYLYGAYSKSGRVSGNSLTIDGQYSGDRSFGVTFKLRGAASESGDVVGNTLSMKNMLLGNYGLTVGHESLTGNVTDNTVELQSVVLNKNPTYIGSLASAGAAERNVLTVRGYKSAAGGTGSELPTNIERIFAAKSGSRAVGNVVNVEDWAYVVEVGGATVDAGLAQDNEVHLRGNHVRVQLVVGAQAHTTGEARGNVIYLESGLRTDDPESSLFLPYGSLTGAHTDRGNATGNRVVVTGGAVAGDIYGARTTSGTAEANLVHINDPSGKHNGFVSGAFSQEGSTLSNRVHIEAGTVTGTIVGGQTVSGLASGNTVQITGGTVRGDIYGGHSLLDGVVKDNTVEISGGTIEGAVYARYVNFGLPGGVQPDHSNSTGNRIVLKGGNLSNAAFYGSNVPFEIAPPPGDCTDDDTCHQGPVEMPDEEPIPGDPPEGVVGATSIATATFGPRTTAVAAETSTLEIDGFSGNVLSVADFDRIDFTNVIYTGTDTDQPILNILDGTNSRLGDTFVSVSRITLEGGTNLTDGATLKLIAVQDAPETTFKYDESKVFDIYQGAGVVAQGSLVASVSGGVGVGAPNVSPEPEPNPGDGDQDGTGGGDDSGNSGGGNTDSGGSDGGNDGTGDNGSTDNPGTDGGDDSGDTDGGNDGAGDNGSTDNPGTGNGGDSGNENPDSGNGDEEPNNPETPEQPEEPDNPGTDDGSGDNSGGSGGIDVDVDNVRMNPQMRLVARTRAASVAFANTGAELVSEKLSALRAETREGGHFFGGIYGKREKFQVASDLDIKGYSAIVGAGWRSRASFADVTGALFYEHGKGDYTTENTFAGQSFDGTGSLRTNGGGAALRFDFENGTHASASIRIGDLNTSMDNVLMDGMDRVWGYDVSSTYYGLTTEIGHEWALSHAMRLEGYAAYGYTYVESADFSIGKEKFEFDAVSSHRLKAGARVHYAVSETSRIMAGLSYEHELDGKTALRTGSIEAEGENIKGGTFGAETGLSFTPSSVSNWTIDATARAFAGERQGVSGTIQSTWRF